MIAPLRKLDVECPPLLSDKSVIERVWWGSIKPGQTLPQYEDVVLGSLGRLGDHLLLFSGATPAEFKVLRAGRKVREWLGADLRDTGLNDLPRDCALALSEVLAQSVEVGAPVRHRMLRVCDGMVETYEMLGFPMACRWGAPLAGVYVGEAGARYNLVDTIFRSTDEGIVALAAVRNAQGEVVDFQIVAINEGAVCRNCRLERRLAPSAIAWLPALARSASSNSNLRSHVEAAKGSRARRIYMPASLRPVTSCR
jgi:hypothetical protein